MTRFPTSLKNCCIRSLAESLDAPVMVHIVREILPGYDIYRQTGYPESIIIPSADVSRQIINDVIKTNKFLKLVPLLIDAQDKGIMGRRYPISSLHEIIKGTYDLGYVFDRANGLFVENSSIRKTRNWGALEVDEEYSIAFLAIDIVGNSQLVRKYPYETVTQTYDDLRNIVTASIEKRNGRIWFWEGDGGLAAFFLGDRDTSASLSAMEIAHELFVYNRMRCRLDDPLAVRMAVHSGTCEYADNGEDLTKMELVRGTMELQKAATPNSVLISVVVKVMLDDFLSRCFKAVGNDKNGPFRFQLRLESS